MKSIQVIRWKQTHCGIEKEKANDVLRDSLIAATALHLGYKVVTRNVRHFEPSGVEWVIPSERMLSSWCTNRDGVLLLIFILLQKLIQVKRR